MDLKTATWMVRNLDQPVSMVQLSSENEVFAGGWDGQLTHWDSEGNHRWTTPTNDRISAIALNETRWLSPAVCMSSSCLVPPEKSCGLLRSKEAPMKCSGGKGTSWPFLRLRY